MQNLADEWLRINRAQPVFAVELLQITWSEFEIAFLNEEIFVQLNELDKLDRITHASIGFSNSLTQTQKSF